MYHRFVCRVPVRDKTRQGHGYGKTLGIGISNGLSGGRGEDGSVGRIEGEGETGGEMDEDDAAPAWTAGVRGKEASEFTDRRAREGSALPAAFVSGGPGHRARWKECGKVFPDERFLTLVCPISSSALPLLHLPGSAGLVKSDEISLQLVARFHRKSQNVNT